MIRTGRWLLLAEKFLANQHIEECFYVCDEIELQLKEMKKEGLEEGEEKLYTQKIKNIKLKLNSLMAQKVRETINKNNVTM